MDSGVLSMRVLVADDMPAIRGIVRGMLFEIGFTQVQDVEEGEGAWALVQDAVSRGEAFGLVIADWQMPGMPGIDLLRAMRASPAIAGTAFVMITGRGGEEHLGEAMRAGANGYLVKPFNKAQLEEKLAAMFP